MYVACFEHLIHRQHVIAYVFILRYPSSFDNHTHKIETSCEVRYYKVTMKTLILTFCLVLGITSVALLTPSIAHAATCGGVDVAYLECETDNSGDPVQDSALWAILTMVLNIMIGAVGIAAVGGLVYAAIMYSSAQDNASQVQQAKDAIRNVIIGLVMFLVMWSGLQFLIPGGIF